jgi:hypothetical protein
MQRERDQFDRLQGDPFWNASLHKPTDASTSKWVVHFIMQARTPNVRNLAGRYVAILDGLMRDKVMTIDAPVARMEGVEAAYEAWQRRPRLRGLKTGSRRHVRTDEEGDASASEDDGGCADFRGVSSTATRQADTSESPSLGCGDPSACELSERTEARINPREVGRARWFTTHAQSCFAPKDSPRLGLRTNSAKGQIPTIKGFP